MGVSREFLFEQLKRLETNYGDKFKINQDLFDLWHEICADCNEIGFRQAVDRCIRESEFAPNIAGVMKYYKEIEKEHDDLEDLINRQYTTIRSIWGEQFEKETFDAIAEYILRFPRKTRHVEMVELTHKMVSFSNDCDVCGRLDKPSIKEYLQGAR